MISVMIVDDEKFQIEDMVDMVDWEKLGFQIVARAFNGKQGLKKYREFRPQLIFTDIRMPFMDGIEMISEIRKEDKKVNLVLLTAYEDFAYAKAAIKHGISEYIMKNEISAESLTSLLMKSREEIESREMQNQVMSAQLLERYFVSAADIDSELDRSFIQKKYDILLLEQDIPMNVSGESVASDYIIPGVKIQDELRNLQYREWKIQAIPRVKREGLVLVLSNTKLEYYDEKELVHYAGKVKKYVDDRLERSFSVSCFDRRISFEELKDYFSSHKNRWQNKYFENAASIHKLILNEKKNLNNISTLNQQHLNYYTNSLKKILEIEHDDDRIQTFFDKLCAEMIELNDYEQMINVVKECYRILVDQNKKMDPPHQIDLSQNRNERFWLDVSGIFSWFTDQFVQIMHTKERFENKYSKTISDSIDYIYRMYSNADLSLEEVADFVHLSPGYLSSAFKKETGKTLKNYVTDVRIDVAKRMIEQGEYKIHEICEKVGYHSSQYFSQVFFKKVGMLPTEYRSSL